MLSDLEARKIASLWHGGGGSKLYALASAGAITDDTMEEINDIMRAIVGADPDGTDPQAAEEEARERAELRTLIDYCIAHGPRGPQPGWADLVW